MKCVNGNNIIYYADKTVEICNGMSECVAFEYGVIGGVGSD
jgi:hypothetical protein